MKRVLDSKEAVESLCRALKGLKIDYTVSYHKLPYHEYADLKYPFNKPHAKTRNNFVECWIVQFQREKTV